MASICISASFLDHFNLALVDANTNPITCKDFWFIRDNKPLDSYAVSAYTAPPRGQSFSISIQLSEDAGELRAPDCSHGMKRGNMFLL